MDMLSFFKKLPRCCEAEFNSQSKGFLAVHFPCQALRPQTRGRTYQRRKVCLDQWPAKCHQESRFATMQLFECPAGIVEITRNVDIFSMLYDLDNGVPPIWQHLLSKRRSPQPHRVTLNSMACGSSPISSSTSLLLPCLGSMFNFNKLGGR